MGSFLTQLQILGCYWTNLVRRLNSFLQHFWSSLSFRAILSVLNILPLLLSQLKRFTQETSFLSEVFFSFRSSQQETQTFHKRSKLFLESITALWTLQFLCLFTYLCKGACVKVRRWLVGVVPTFLLPPGRFQGPNSSCQTSGQAPLPDWTNVLALYISLKEYTCVNVWFFHLCQSTHLKYVPTHC